MRPGPRKSALSTSMMSGSSGFVGSAVKNKAKSFATSSLLLLPLLEAPAPWLKAREIAGASRVSSATAPPTPLGGMLSQCRASLDSHDRGEVAMIEVGDDSGYARFKLPSVTGALSEMLVGPLVCGGSPQKGFKQSLIREDSEASDLSLEPLFGTGSSYVEDIGSHRIASAEYADGPPGRGEFEAAAVPPCILEIDLPASWQGQPLCMNGPMGPVTVRPRGPEAVPGTCLRMRIAPHPEFRIEVPPDAAAGTEINFRRANGDHVSVIVPAGLAPGDRFHVLPPAIMVHAPAGVASGDTVRFRPPGASGGALWLRCVVPKGIAEHDYFPARLPIDGI
mmetsp:Transcript_88207/g.254552  ORF Transcript_88207/g.254552 Transcript_88207/m.254552 type:complete len:336 (+) Transcript_88207:2122-3129(+)